MKFVIAMVIIIGLSIGGYQFYQYWGKFKDKDTDTVAAPPPPQASLPTGDQLSGLPPKLWPILDTAQRRGASGLHDFLETYGNQIQDPRKAWIELDYVELLSQSSPGEARRLFHEVQSRIQPDSPVYGRIKLLEKTYE